MARSERPGILVMGFHMFHYAWDNAKCPSASACAPIACRLTGARIRESSPWGYRGDGEQIISGSAANGLPVFAGRKRQHSASMTSMPLLRDMFSQHPIRLWRPNLIVRNESELQAISATRLLSERPQPPD